MARTHARVLSSIWTDPDFIALSVEAQRMYLLLLSQDSLDNAGRLLLTIKRWAAGCQATSTGDVEKALAELDAARFIVVDYETEEVLIRSFIRNDGIVKQPQMMKSALREALVIRSPLLRAALARELRRLRRDDAAFTADQIDPGPSFDPGPGDGERHANSPVQAQLSLPEGCEQGPGSVPEASAKAAGSRRGGGRGSSSSPDTSTQVGKGAAKRGTRIPDDFTVTQAMVVWARRECPDVDGRFATAQFVDYWHAESGAKAVKLDWVRAWQTWMRREQRDAARRGPHLRSVPAPPMRPSDPAAAFDDLRERADGVDAARILGIPYLPEPQPPSDLTPRQVWKAARAREWIDAHETELRAALAARCAG